MSDFESEMNFDNVLNRLKKLNPDINISEKIPKFKQDIEFIFKEYEKIKDSYDYFDGDKAIKNPYDINKNQNEIDYSLIAEMIYFNKKCFGFIPRKIQILSLIYFLEKDKMNGLVQQINTGEGKSCIISFLAVYISLKEKKKIDILTSSPVLAKRDSKIFKEFYKCFNLTVDYTSDHNENAKENNRIFTQNSYECYEANIVYGDTLSFEGDILRTNFMGIKGRGKERNFDCIIIDEIDNIALDNLKNTTELLDSFHGYKFLEYVYFFIYKKLKEITEKTKENVHDKKEEIIKELNDECIKEFSDLSKLRREKFVFIPNHLKQYILNRLSDWCESAYLAKFVYHNNENYIKRIDKEYDINVINPIDFYNTGVTQENSVWAGLHQLLQIREKQMITEENLSSCYMSNLSFFNKYIKKNEQENIIENNIYGLTGTIGSEYNKKTLKALYNLDSLIIPPFKQSLLKIEDPIIIIMKNEKSKEKDKETETEEKPNNKQPIEKKGNQEQTGFNEKWIDNIKKKIINEIKRERSVLVIFQYISEAVRMKKILMNMSEREKCFNNVVLYSRSDKDEGKFLEKVIETKTVILSTNLSGRGTDIRISSELNDNGGLHVILTYEPFNKRIERQAFGRAGRKGENGSAGKIIISCMTQEEAIEEINKREKEESDFLINIYSKKIFVFEKIFDKFSKFISEINEITNNEILLLDLKERWGLFLIENSMNNIEKRYKKNHESIGPDTFTEIENNYNIFEKRLRDYYYGNDIVVKKPMNIFTKFNNITDNLNTNKKPYPYLNGLYLNKENNIEKVNKGIKLCPYLCLGGYMFNIIEYINNINLIPFAPIDNNNIYINIIKKIEKAFEQLIYCIQLLIKQFETYKNIIRFLGFNKDNFEINQQNNSKIELMGRILVLMNKNFRTFLNYKNNEKKNSTFLRVQRFALKKFIDNENLKVNKLVLEYFREYGLCLFIVREEEKKKSDNCFIY